MSDNKAPAFVSVVLDVVAGSGKSGGADGPLSRSTFYGPSALCRYGDSLLMADEYAHTIRAVDGVLGVARPMAMEGKGDDAAASALDYEARAVPLITSAVPALLPKELARVIAQYALSRGRVRTIAGSLKSTGLSRDGHALREARFQDPCAVALDTSDPVAGPRLMICDAGVRCLNLRTEQVTTIVVGGRAGHVDGSASGAKFVSISQMVAAPTGVLFVTDAQRGTVRRIGAAKGPAATERVVTTLIGTGKKNGTGVQYAASSTKCFRKTLSTPKHMALHWPVGADDPDRDIGRLFVGCADGVHAFDLALGERKCYVLPPGLITGLAVTDDGARLFVVTALRLAVVDLHTGARTDLVAAGGERLSRAMGCVIDAATRSLILCDQQSRQIVRVCGVAI